MAETVGLLIVGAIAPGAITGIGFGSALSGATLLGINVATAVGTVAILGASIGLQYALSNPSLPRPEEGSQALKQAIPPRIRGYGVNRLAGYYMLFEAAGPPPAISYDLLAFHSGRVDSVLGFYLSDDLCVTEIDISHGGGANILSPYADARYGYNHVVVEVGLGRVPQAASNMFTNDPLISPTWTVAHQGNGIAYVAMRCACPDDPTEYSRIYPRGHPEMSVIAICSPIWDPRDPSQSRDNESTWKPSYNPVIQLMDYLCREDGGMGLNLDEILPPARLAEWMVEANLCDETVDKANGGFERRYSSHGWFRFDTSPEEVINAILASCDGWLAESGDGTMSITVGVYREPTDPPLSEKHVTGFRLSYGASDEQLINVLNVSFTDPAMKYIEAELGEVRDEESISLAGVERAKKLSLKWVQSSSQASRLADRAMQRVNPIMSGSFTTTLYGLRYLGRRWVPIQYPFVSGLQDSIVEIQNAEVDLLGGQITWDFNLIEPSKIEAYDPDADELPAPPVPPSEAPRFLMREDSTPLNRETGSAYIREN